MRTHSRREFALDVHSRISHEDSQVIGPDYRIVATIVSEIEAFISANGSAVLKSPLSGSGKGIRFVREKLSESDRGWCMRTLDKLGSVIVGHYKGFLGVDQIICQINSPVFIPVSEINLRTLSRG